MPGFLVGAVFGFLEVGGEDDGGLVVGGEDGEDVPGVGGDDEGGEEVELVGAVEDVARADGADVGVAALVDRAFHLYAAEESVMVPSVAVALSGQAKRHRRERFLPRAWRRGIRARWRVA